jgi:hypothetical protein
MQALLSRDIQQIEIDSIEQYRSRRLRTRTDETIVPALVSVVAIPLSAIRDIG